MQAYLHRKYLKNGSYYIKFEFPKLCLKMNFKMLFYKVFSLISKDHFSNHISILHYAIKTLFGQFIKFYCENLVITILKCCVDFYKNLKISLSSFEAKIQKL
jgi:hypothetical protein